MSSDRALIKDLLQKYMTDAINDQEKSVLATAVGNMDDTLISEILQEHWNENETVGYQLTQKEMEANLSKILNNKIHPVRERAYKIGRKKSVVLFLFGLLFISGLYLVFFNDNTGTDKNDIPGQNLVPGSNKATIKFSEKEIIALHEVNKDQILSDHINLKKIDEGHYKYTSVKGSKPSEQITISTPRGGNFSLTLDDGTRIWLNASSSLKFPSRFGEESRIVELTGEAFFDVNTQNGRPFIVRIPKKFDVVATGTQFNVKAYDDMVAPSAALIEGKVNISTIKGNTFNLIPGDEAFVGSDVNVSGDTNIDEVSAWKNGLFVFDRTSLNEIMRQVSLWYDVDVTFEGQDRGKTFSGIVDKKNNASDVLKILTLAGIKFEIEGKKIHVIQ